jgi:hypothetical protein
MRFAIASRTMSSEDAEVLAAAERLVETARRIIPDYGAGFIPLRTDQLSRLLVGAECHLEVFSFRSDTVAMVLPRCAGVYPILLNREAERTDALLALRHELGHVLAGDVDGVIFMAASGCMTLPERAADLFALTDLVPAGWIRRMQRDRMPAREVAREVEDAVRGYAEDWDPERLQDRVRLRCALFRRQGI